MRTRHPQQDHSTFAKNLANKLDSWLKRRSRRLKEEHLNAALVLLRINLDPIRLIQVAVIPSAQRGLLGDVSNLAIAGDGTALRTAASPHGRPTCDCRSKGIYQCDCDRFYTDPTADWGYDSYRKGYYFGHTLYQHVVSSEGHDLPIHVTIGPASETDFTLSLKSLDRLRKALKEAGLDWSIQHAIYDAGHDALGVYEYLDAAHITPVIALNPRKGETPSYPDIKLNEQGIPLCPAGLPMRRHTYNHKQRCTLYHCPVKRPTHREGKRLWTHYPDECPHKTLCQPDTKMGPCLCIKSEADPRLFPPIPRHTPRFKALMNLRSGCERSNSAKKECYRLGNRLARNASHFLMRAYLVSIIEHAKAWLAEDKKRFGEDPFLLMPSQQKVTLLAA